MKWNMIAGLPKALNTDLRNLHLVTCSNEVSTLELAKGFIGDLVKLETEGIAVYDAHLQCEVLLIAPVMAILGDNPRASEVVCHMGSSANKFCRMCMVRCMCVNNTHPVSTVWQRCQSSSNFNKDAQRPRQSPKWLESAQHKVSNSNVYRQSLWIAYTPFCWVHTSIFLPT